MAGTRLLIQTAVAVEFLLLVAVALYFGLCQQDDVICSALYGNHASLPPLTDKTSIDVPIISVVVPASDEQQWKASLQQLGIPSIKVGTSEKQSEVCREKVGSHLHHHIWICPETETVPRENANAARVEVMPDGIALVYARQDIASVVKALFVSSSRNAPIHRWSLRLNLVMEDGQSWNWWSQALTELATEIPFSNLPCLKGGPPSVGLVLDGGLSEMARPMRHENKTRFLLLSGDAQQYVLDHAATNRDSLLNVGLYIPSREKIPLVVKGDGGTLITAFAVSRDMVSIVSRIPEVDEPLESYKQVLRLALDHSVPFLRSQCLDIPSTERIQMQSKGALPSWQVQMTMQRLLHDLHVQAYNKLLIVRQSLIGSLAPANVIEAASLQFENASKVLDEAIAYSNNGQWTLAVDQLETSLETCMGIVHDPSFMEPLDFPMDHYFAVFSPLLFPLLLPVVAGLVREWKRYKELQKKKDESEEAEKETASKSVDSEEKES